VGCAGAVLRPREKERRPLVTRLLMQVLSTINNWLEYSAAEGMGAKGLVPSFWTLK